MTTATLVRKHLSDCAVHNAPAMKPGPCDCPGAEMPEGEGCNCEPCVRGHVQFVPGISNDKSITEDRYGESWQVANYLDADDVRFVGTFADCEAFIGRGCVHCSNCRDTGHVCENHPEKPWAGLADGDTACECGAGMPCPSCCSPIPQDGTTSITQAFVPDRLRV